MIVSICPFSNLDPRCTVGRIYGTTSCGCHGFREDFFKVSQTPHFNSIEAYDSMASINTRSMDGGIYVGDHKVRNWQRSGIDTTKHHT